MAQPSPPNAPPTTAVSAGLGAEETAEEDRLNLEDLEQFLPRLRLRDIKAVHDFHLWYISVRNLSNVPEDRLNRIVEILQELFVMLPMNSDVWNALYNFADSGLAAGLMAHAQAIPTVVALFHREEPLGTQALYLYCKILKSCSDRDDFVTQSLQVRAADALLSFVAELVEGRTRSPRKAGFLALNWFVSCQAGARHLTPANIQAVLRAFHLCKADPALGGPLLTSLLLTLANLPAFYEGEQHLLGPARPELLSTLRDVAGGCLHADIPAANPASADATNSREARALAAGIGLANLLAPPLSAPAGSPRMDQRGSQPAGSHPEGAEGAEGGGQGTRTGKGKGKGGDRLLPPGATAMGRTAVNTTEVLRLVKCLEAAARGQPYCSLRRCPWHPAQAIYNLARINPDNALCFLNGGVLKPLLELVRKGWDSDGLDLQSARDEAFVIRALDAMVAAGSELGHADPVDEQVLQSLAATSLCGASHMARWYAQALAERSRHNPHGPVLSLTRLARRSVLCAVRPGALGQLITDLGLPGHLSDFLFEEPPLEARVFATIRP